MIEHRFIILDRGKQRVGEIVNYTSCSYKLQTSNWGYFKITIPTNFPEARKSFMRPLEHYIQYYRDGVLTWEGVIVNRRHTADTLRRQITITAYGILWLLSKRKADFVHINKTGAQIITDSLATVNAFYPTYISMGNSNISYLFDREEYDIPFFDLLQTFGNLGFEYGIRNDSGNWKLDFKDDLGAVKIDDAGNPTFTLFNGEGGNIEDWEDEEDATEFVNSLTGLGSGTGVAQTTWTESNEDSRTKYGLFQDSRNYPDIDSEYELSLLVGQDLQTYGDIVESFEFSMTKGTYDFQSFSVGDTIFVKCSDREYISEKWIKIDSIEVGLKSSGFEEVKLGVNILL